MGICESSKEKEKDKNILKNNPQVEIDNKNSIKNNTSSNNDEDNMNGVETHPSSNSQENEIKKPELPKYDGDNKRSELSYNKSGKIMSTISSQNEEELIIRGEINKNVVNKDGDFDNKDFKNLFKQNGGIIIKDNDNLSNVLSYQGLNPALDIGKVSTFSEFKSLNTYPIKPPYNQFGFNNYGLNLNLIDNNGLNFNGGELIQNINNNTENLRMSSKINVSFHDNAMRNDAFINIPKTDEPLPNTDEFSNQSPIILRDSLISK